MAHGPEGRNQIKGRKGDCHIDFDILNGEAVSLFLNDTMGRWPGFQGLGARPLLRDQAWPAPGWPPLP